MLVGILAILTVLVFPISECIPEDSMYPFGAQHGDSLLTRGDDNGVEVSLEHTVRLYGESFTSVFVNTNGAISFDTALPQYQEQRLPIEAKMIAPLFSDIDTRQGGWIYYRETDDRDLLSRAQTDVRSHFTLNPDFTAENLFIVTWYLVPSFPFGMSQAVNTFQLVLISDGQCTFSELLYADEGIQWTVAAESKAWFFTAQIPAQAAFSGENYRLYPLDYSGTDEIKKLAEESNMGIAGNWIYLTGWMGMVAEDLVGLPDRVDAEEYAYGLDNTIDEGECNRCDDTSAECLEQDVGQFCCVCIPPRYGNGRDCLIPGEPQRLNGKLTGILNDVVLSNVDIHSYIVSSEGRIYTAMSRIPQIVGHSMQMIPFIGGGIDWMFALPRDQAVNGFTITGGTFTRDVTVRFASTGHVLTINQQFNGFDQHNTIQMVSEINGAIPTVLPPNNISVETYKDVYRRTAPGVIESLATRVIHINNEPTYEVQISERIEFDECRAADFIDPLRLVVSRTFRLYERVEQIVRFAGIFTIEPVALDGPCERNTCHSFAYCTPAGSDTYDCFCNEGYEGSGWDCADIDECSKGTNSCDPNARCLNNAGSYTCMCLNGYEGDGRRCSATPSHSSPGFLLFAQDMAIMQMPFPGADDVVGGLLISLELQTVVGLDFDCLDRYYYWTDVASRTINRAHIDSHEYETIVRDLGSPEGVAVDWMSRNIYWTDSETKTIEVANLDGRNRKVLFETDLEYPRAIVVDPENGHFYWTDWNREAPKIETADMDGSNRRILIEDDIALPNGLTLDYSTDQLCWVDAGLYKVECAGSANGAGRRVVAQDLNYPFGLTNFDNKLYWTDWNDDDIQSVAEFGSSDLVVEHLEPPKGSSGKMFGVAVARQCLGGFNGCSTSNGGCSHLCLAIPGDAHVCTCPTYPEYNEVPCYE